MLGSVRKLAATALGAILLALLGTAASAGDLIYFDENGGPAGPRGFYDFDSATGASTLRAVVGGGVRLFSLARHPTTGVVYAVDPGSSSLYTVNLDSGSVTLVAATGLLNLSNLAIHPSTGVLYGLTRGGGDKLYRIDPATAAPTLVGSASPVQGGLAFSSVGVLYGTTAEGVLYTVSTSTGAAALIGGPGGLAQVEDGKFTLFGRYFVTDYNGSLHELQPASGQLAPGLSTGNGNGLLGLAAEICKGGKSYCTGKVSSNVCLPAIGSTGLPSLASPFTFHVATIHLETGVNALTFFGTSGPSSTPFQGGLLCVKLPVHRLPLASSGGASACSGQVDFTLSQMLAHPAGGPQVTEAAKVYCQTWMRDPGSPSTTGLSNGLEFTVCPR